MGDAGDIEELEGQVQDEEINMQIFLLYMSFCGAGSEHRKNTGLKFQRTL